MNGGVKEGVRERRPERGQEGGGGVVQGGRQPRNLNGFSMTKVRFVFLIYTEFIAFPMVLP